MYIHRHKYVQSDLNNARNHGGSEFLNCKIAVRTGKQPHGDARLAHKICVVLGNYDCNRPILTIIRTIYSSYLIILNP